MVAFGSGQHPHIPVTYWAHVLPAGQELTPSLQMTDAALDGSDRSTSLLLVTLAAPATSLLQSAPDQPSSQ